MATCTVDGCDKPVRSRNATLCAMHYHRQYRHGSVAKSAATTTIKVSARRYRSTQRPGHPLAPPSGRMYVHRVVLFDKIGRGPHPCHWCGRSVAWKARGDCALVPDHLNNDGSDNRPENLVPCCTPCNARRGAQRRSAALRDAGWWSEHDTIANLTGTNRAPIMEPA